MWIVERQLFKDIVNPKVVFVIKKISLPKILRTYGIKVTKELYRAKLIGFKKSELISSIHKLMEQEKEVYRKAYKKEITEILKLEQ